MEKIPKRTKIVCTIIFVFFILIPLVLGLLALLTGSREAEASFDKTSQTPVNALSHSVKVSANVLPMCDDLDPNVHNNWDTGLKLFKGDVCAYLEYIGYTTQSWTEKCPHQKLPDCDESLTF